MRKTVGRRTPFYQIKKIRKDQENRRNKRLRQEEQAIAWLEERGVFRIETRKPREAEEERSFRIEQEAKEN